MRLPAVQGLKISLVLWATVYALVAVVSVWSGNTDGLGGGLIMTSWLASALAVSSALFLIFNALADRPRWVLWPGMAAAVVLCGAVQSAADYAAWFAVAAVLPEAGRPRTTPNLIMRTLVYYFVLYGVNATLLWTTAAALRGRRQALSLAEARAAEAEARLLALRLQLNPHFLLNSLNSVAALVSGGRAAEAEEMIVQLGEFLRAALQFRPDGLIPLRDELAAVVTYVDLERPRLPDRFALDIDCPPEVGAALVPDFLLQPLVENALRKGAGARGGKLALSARKAGDDLILVVADDWDDPELCAPGLGIGLQNTRERLQLLFGASATLEVQTGPTPYSVLVRHPFRIAEERQPGAASRPY
jgi:LytS/YehU family sensor histidine kinase